MQCETYDAIVVGLGWAGVSALVELNEYEKQIQPDFTFMALEANPWIGGRAGRAKLISGAAGPNVEGDFDTNPLFDILDQFSDVNTHRFTWRLHEVYEVYNMMAQPKDTNEKRVPRQAFNDAMECVEEYLNQKMWTDGITSIDKALGADYCGYEPQTNPSEGSWENIWYDLNIGAAFTFRGDKLSVYGNLPLSTYDDYGPMDYYIQHEMAGAKLAQDYLFGRFGSEQNAADHYRLRTEVQDIQWCNSDGKAKVETNNGCYLTDKIIFTGSFGVLNVRGDDAWNPDYRMFSPPLPAQKMQDIREFIMPGDHQTLGKRRDMGTLVEISIQFDDDTWYSGSLDIPEHTMLYIETGVGERGHCNMWHSLDADRSGAPGQSETFWPGSHAFTCWMNTEELESITNAVGGDLSDDDVKDLIKGSLAKVLGADASLIDSCSRFNGFPFIQETNRANSNGPCLIHVQGDGINRFFEGSWNNDPVGDWNDDTYYRAVAPLEGSRDCPADSTSSTTIVISGEYTCSRNAGYQHGGLMSGRRSVRELLKWDGVGDYWCDEDPHRMAAGVEGDPHFLTWSSKWYDFMGACDLHLVKAPHFAPDLPLVIDIRTRIRYQYSYIESAVVQIGNETLEVGSYGNHWLNGVDDALPPDNVDAVVAPKLSGYSVKHTQVNKKSHKFVIDLGKGETILLKVFKDMISILLDNADVKRFRGSLGMMGEFGTGHMLARDGKTVVNDPNLLAAEWQVRGDEPMLFQTVNGPQHPQACKMPDPAAESRRRLGESIARSIAEKACANWTPDTKENCIKDVRVLATGDLELAGAGAF